MGEKVNKNKKKKAFTLVELIVVITILAILGSIAFITMQDFSSEARDSARLTDISQFRSGIEIYNAQSSEFPLPDSIFSVETTTGGKVNYKGYTGELATKNAGVSKELKDPLTGEFYIYATEGNNSSYEVSYSLEMPSASLVKEAHANFETTIVTGNYNGVFATASDGTKVAMPTLITSEIDGTEVSNGTTDIAFTLNGQSDPVVFRPSEVTTGADTETIISDLKAAYSYSGIDGSIALETPIADVLSMTETDANDQARFESGYLKKVGTTSGSRASTPTYSCTGSLVTANATISNNTGLTADTPYQNTDSLADCYYECVFGFAGNSCQIVEQRLFSSDIASKDRFGFTTAMSSDGNTAIVSSVLDGVGGSVYVFTYSDGVWGEKQKLIPSDLSSADYFGWSMSISSNGEVIAVGTPYHNSNGAVYLFTKTGGIWSQSQKLTASDGVAGDHFGYTVSMSSSGSTIIVGAQQSEGYKGSSYVFTESGGIWSESQRLTASDGEGGDYFGRAVSISSDGGTAIIGSILDNDNGRQSGSVYVFSNSGGLWSEHQKLTASDGFEGDRFGNSLSLSGDGNTAIISSYMDDDKGSASGSAYIFTNSGGVWSEIQKLTPLDGAESDYFGTRLSTASDGRVVIISAIGNDDKGSSAGSVYIFRESEGMWLEDEKLVSSDGEASDYFGMDVGMSYDGSKFVVGAYGNSDNGQTSGSVYFY